MKSIEPLNNRVVVKRAKAPEATQGGILIPSTSQDKSDEGLVMGVGPNVAQVTEGDRVLFGKYSGTDIELEGETVTVMREDDIIAIIR